MGDAEHDEGKSGGKRGLFRRGRRDDTVVETAPEPTRRQAKRSGDMFVRRPNDDAWSANAWAEDDWDDDWSDPRRRARVRPAADPRAEDVDAWLASGSDDFADVTRDIAERWTGKNADALTGPVTITNRSLADNDAADFDTSFGDEDDPWNHSALRTTNEEPKIVIGAGSTWDDDEPSTATATASGAPTATPAANTDSVSAPVISNVPDDEGRPRFRLGGRIREAEARRAAEQSQAAATNPPPTEVTAQTFESATTSPLDAAASRGPAEPSSFARSIRPITSHSESDANPPGWSPKPVVPIEPSSEQLRFDAAPATAGASGAPVPLSDRGDDANDLSEPADDEIDVAEFATDADADRDVLDTPIDDEFLASLYEEFDDSTTATRPTPSGDPTTTERATNDVARALSEPERSPENRSPESRASQADAPPTLIVTSTPDVDASTTSLPKAVPTERKGFFRRRKSAANDFDDVASSSDDSDRFDVAHDPLESALDALDAFDESPTATEKPIGVASRPAVDFGRATADASDFSDEYDDASTVRRADEASSSEESSREESSRGSSLSGSSVDDAAPRRRRLFGRRDRDDRFTDLNLAPVDAIDDIAFDTDDSQEDESDADQATGSPARPTRALAPRPGSSWDDTADLSAPDAATSASVPKPHTSPTPSIREDVATRPVPAPRAVDTPTTDTPTTHAPTTHAPTTDTPTTPLATPPAIVVPALEPVRADAAPKPTPVEPRRADTSTSDRPTVDRPTVDTSAFATTSATTSAPAINTPTNLGRAEQRRSTARTNDPTVVDVAPDADDTGSFDLDTVGEGLYLSPAFARVICGAGLGLLAVTCARFLLLLAGSLATTTTDTIGEHDALHRVGAAIHDVGPLHGLGLLVGTILVILPWLLGDPTAERRERAVGVGIGAAIVASLIGFVGGFAALRFDLRTFDASNTDRTFSDWTRMLTALVTVSGLSLAALLVGLRALAARRDEFSE